MSESEALSDSVIGISQGRRVGKFLGEHVVRQYTDRRVDAVSKFNIHTSGPDRLPEYCQNKPIIVAANHLISFGTVDQGLGFSPDALVIQQEYKRLTGIDLKIVAKVDDGRIRKTRLGRYIQSKDPELRKGVGEGMGLGLIPLLKNPGSNNQEFFQTINSLLQGNVSVLIFPQGDWFDDFEPERRVYSGMSVFAKRNNALIVPTYIKGAHSWTEGQRVDVAFGEPIDPQGKKVIGINNEWNDSVSKLKQKVLEVI